MDQWNATDRPTDYWLYDIRLSGGCCTSEMNNLKDYLAITKQPSFKCNLIIYCLIKTDKPVQAWSEVAAYICFNIHLPVYLK